jgi:hypothetical protein
VSRGGGGAGFCGLSHRNGAFSGRMLLSSRMLCYPYAIFCQVIGV